MGNVSGQHTFAVCTVTEMSSMVKCVLCVSCRSIEALGLLECTDNLYIIPVRMLSPSLIVHCECNLHTVDVC